MRRRTKSIIALVVSLGVITALTAIILWCVRKGEEPVRNETTPTPTVAGIVTPGMEESGDITQAVAPTEEIKPENEPTNVPVVEPTKEVEPTEAVEPTVAPEEEITPTDAPVITNPASPTPVDAGPTTMPEVTKTPSVTEVPEIEPTTVPEPTKEPTVAPSATPTPTKAPAVTPTPTPLPTVTPTPAPQRKYTHEVKMGDNVWYRLSDDRVLYVMGTGATWGYDMYVDEGGYYRGDTSGMGKLMKIDGVQHIVIEEGITKLGAWSLMWLPDVQSITIPDRGLLF